MTNRMTQIKQITLPWPHKDLRGNSRAHHMAKHRAFQQHKEWARIACLEAPRVQTSPNAHIFFEYYPPSNRGDVDNVHPGTKAYLDGIAAAMGCDDKGFRPDYPNQFAGTKAGGAVVIRIVPPVVNVPFMGTV